MLIKIKVIPGSSINQVKLEPDGLVKVKVTASAVDGKANEAVIKLLGKYYKTAKSNIQIIKGHKNKQKTIMINK